MIRVLDPTDGPAAQRSAMAERPEKLDGKVVALIDNGKLNSDTVLREIGAQLRKRHGVKEVVYFRKRSSSHAITGQEAETLAKKCHVAISGIGD
ncbi:hypothetical protein BSNK01_18660 [Bacillaceae bacterium]